MKEQAGKIIDFVRENRTVPGCTISKQIYHENGTGISIFCLEKVFLTPNSNGRLELVQ